MLFIRRKLLGKDFRQAHTAAFACLTIIWIGYYMVTDSGVDVTNLVFWPTAYFLALWLIGFSVPRFFLKLLSQKFHVKVIYHLGIAVLFGIIHMILTDVFIVLIERFLNLPEHFILGNLPTKWLFSWHHLFHGFIWYIIYIGTLNMFYFQALYLAEEAKNHNLSASLSDARVKTLSTELNPHFLFNAMNSIVMQVRKNENSLAVEGLADLGDMLRAVLTTRDEIFISLKKEIELLNHYISLEKKRFGEKINIEIDCHPKILHYSVPKLLLQPIVENAFKHGINLNNATSVLSVQIVEKESFINIQVFNSSNEKIKWPSGVGKSVGLPNTVERLRRLYGADYVFQIKQSEAGVLIDITLPKRT
ncbi:MAG: histidine kinase [Bacteroidota bacterium]